jgi:hypothetical protein
MTASGMSDPNVTDDWASWRRSVFGDPYMVWPEGPDFRVLISIAQTDLNGVTHMLTCGLEAKDPLAAQSFEALIAEGLPPERSESILRTAIETADGEFRIRLAEALHTLTADESGSAPIAEELASASHWSERSAAAWALAVFIPTDTLRKALAQAVRDSDSVVRYKAASVLLIYAGVHTEVSGDRELLQKIRSDAGPRDWRAASDKLLAIAQSNAGNQGGRPPRPRRPS